MFNNTNNSNSLFCDSGVHIAASFPFASVDALMPEERIVIKTAVEKRQREFATSRVLARRLLAKFGVHQYPLLNDKDRVPIWPAEILGSISHCDGCCLVVIQSKNNQTTNIGVDVEPDAPIDPELWPSIATSRELEWISAQDGVDSGRLMRLLFCAKEAFYKSVYPISRTMFDFHDIEIDIDLRAKIFHPKILDTNLSVNIEKPIVTGRFQRSNRLIFTSCSLLASTSTAKNSKCATEHY